MKFTDDNRKEILSEVPLEVPLDAERPLTIQEQIARMVKGYYSKIADENGEETFDEANDFEISGDDFEMEPTSQFQEEYFGQFDEKIFPPQSGKEGKEQSSAVVPPSEDLDVSIDKTIPNDALKASKQEN